MRQAVNATTNATTTPRPSRPAPPRRRAAPPLAALLLLGLAACNTPRVEWQNRQPAQALAREAGAPVGSVYAGWRVYQQRCAACHGNAATGGDGVPDLTFRLRDVGPQRFVDLVLRRYDWDLPQGSSPREILVDDIVGRARGTVQMPAWQGEPTVSAHIMDLYAYLSARADGRQGPERPVR